MTQYNANETQNRQKPVSDRQLNSRIVNLYGPDDVRIDTMSIPEPGSDQVLVKVMVCGICGSDLGYLAAGGLMGPGPEPMPLGHELSAVVIAVGPGVSGFEPGMRVVVNPMEGGNDIGNGGSEGGFADYLLVHNVSRGQVLMELPDHVDFHRGALVEPLSVALHAVNRSGLQKGERAVVFGAGPIGLGAVAALQQRGAADVVVVEPSAARRSAAAAMGADAVIDPATDNPWQLLADRHGKRPLYGFDLVTTDVVIDACGITDVLQQAITNVAEQARIVVVALHRQPIALDLMTVLMKELTVCGAMGYPSAEFAEVLDWLRHGHIDPTPMMSERFSLAEFMAAINCAKDPGHGGKVLVEIGV